MKPKPNLVCLVLLATTLCSCAGMPQPQLTAAPPLAVNLSALKTCEQILRAVALPPANAKTDARVAFVKDDAALITARREIEQGRRCVADVRRRYAQPK